MIRYAAKLESDLWMRKCTVPFDTIDDMKQFVADEKTRFWHQPFSEEDVKLEQDCEYDYSLCLHHCSRVLVDGRLVGYCGD